MYKSLEIGVFLTASPGHVQIPQVSLIPDLLAIHEMTNELTAPSTKEELCIPKQNKVRFFEQLL
jgi:hypothetical protein